MIEVNKDRLINEVLEGKTWKHHMQRAGSSVRVEAGEGGRMGRLKHASYVWVETT